MSKLFKLATGAVARRARRDFARSPIGRLTSEARRIAKAGSKRQSKALGARLLSPEAKKLLQELEKAGGAVTRYGAKEETTEALDQLLRVLGPLGNVIRSVIAPRGRSTRSWTDDQAEAAVAFLRSLGAEVLTKPGTKHHDRGVQAARELVAELVTPPPVRSEPKPSGDAADEWPEEQVIQTLGRGAIGYDEEATRELVGKEIKVQSSNVYSFVYEKETARTGILYVTFLAWSPGTGKRQSPGPTYAYYDVPLSKYRQFAAAAKDSAGRAVWDYLRVRGTVHDHQHTYRLAAGTMVPGGGVYVPRKATAEGFKKRAVASHGMGRRSFNRSTLPERTFVNRAQPNRGRPNRGR